MNSIKKYNVFSNSLGIPGLIVVAFFLVFGLKTKFDYNFFNAPPNVFEFNMYVFEMTSLIDGGYYPDIYVKKDGDFILVERDLIKETLAFNFLFANDRWARDENLVNDYFCDRQVLKKLNLEQVKLNDVLVRYLKNGTSIEEESYEISC